MKKYMLIDKVKNKIYDFDDAEEFLSLERMYLQYSYIMGYKFNFLNNFRILVIKGDNNE